jgi:hypothetical protein
MTAACIQYGEVLRLHQRERKCEFLLKRSRRLTPEHRSRLRSSHNPLRHIHLHLPLTRISATYPRTTLDRGICRMKVYHRLRCNKTRLVSVKMQAEMQGQPRLWMQAQRQTRVLHQRLLLMLVQRQMQALHLRLPYQP